MKSIYHTENYDFSARRYSARMKLRKLGNLFINSLLPRRFRGECLPPHRARLTSASRRAAAVAPLDWADGAARHGGGREKWPADRPLLLSVGLSRASIEARRYFS